MFVVDGEMIKNQLYELMVGYGGRRTCGMGWEAVGETSHDGNFCLGARRGSKWDGWPEGRIYPRLGVRRTDCLAGGPFALLARLDLSAGLQASGEPDPKAPLARMGRFARC